MKEHHAPKNEVKPPISEPKGEGKFGFRASVHKDTDIWESRPTRHGVRKRLYIIRMPEEWGPWMRGKRFQCDNTFGVEER